MYKIHYKGWSNVYNCWRVKDELGQQLLMDWYDTNRKIKNLLDEVHARACCLLTCAASDCEATR